MNEYSIIKKGYFNISTRIKKTMKLTLYLLFTGILFINATDNYSQEMRISLDLKSTSIKEICQEIENKSDYMFVFSDNVEKAITKKVDINAVAKNVDEILDAILSNTDLDYNRLDKQIALYISKADKTAKGAANATVAETVQQQKKQITGKVIDSDGIAIIGANVVEVGTSNGTITDIDGSFSLNISENATIKITYIGYLEILIDTAGKTKLNIVLEEDTQTLDELVVTGYQTLSKERSTGSFARVKSEDLEIKRIDNLSSVLEGQVAGYVDGNIRGITTMNAIDKPMVVIDGFPVENTTISRIGDIYENMPELNPEDIESITVLKDAAAASIYGARASNGVIVITTKKARLGKTDLSFSSTITTQPYSNYVKNRMNSAEMIQLERDWIGTTNIINGMTDATTGAAEIREQGGYSRGVDILLDMYTDKISMADGNGMLDNLAARGYNYYDEVKRYGKRNPVYQQYNLRVGKGSGRNSFNFSTTYWDEKYEDVNSDNSKLGVNITNSTEVYKWLQLDLGLYLKYEKGYNQSYNMLSPGFSIMPYDGLVNPDGSYISAITQNNRSRDEKIEAYGLNSEIVTPMDELNYRIAKNNSFDTRAFTNLNIDFTSWLNLGIMFQYQTADQKSETLQEKESEYMRSLINNFTTENPYVEGLDYNLPNGNSLGTSGQITNAYTFRYQLNFNKTVDEKHDFAWIGGQEVRETLIKLNANSHYGYDPDLLSWETYNEQNLASYFNGILGYASLNPAFEKYKRELKNRFVSFYSNGSYIFDNRYILTGSIRWDRSNLWGTSSEFQKKPLWSVGGSWNIDKEDSFAVDYIDMLKVRMSYGVGGNIGRNTAPYLIANYYASNEFGGLTGQINSPPNPDIRWEKTATTNIGVDFAMLKNRVYGSIDLYNKSSVDLLADTRLSPTQGFGYSTMKINNGEINNKGFELTLNADVIKNKDFSWSSTLLYAFNKNKVISASNKTDLASSMISMPSSYPTINEPLHGIYAFRWAGLSSTGEPQIYNADGEIVSTNVTTSDALYYAGTVTPTHSAAFTNVLRYRNFDFSAMLTFAAKHKIRSSEIPTISMSNGFARNTYNSINDRWMEAGDEKHTDVPRLLFSHQDGYNGYRNTLYAYSDQFIASASNIKIRNISFAYRVPTYLSKKAYLSNIRLQFNIENLAVFAFDEKAKYDLGVYNKPNYVFGLYLNF